MSLGQLAQTWSTQSEGDASGQVVGEVSGSEVLFEMAFSNIDDAAPDGLTGATDVLVEVSVE